MGNCPQCLIRNSYKIRISTLKFEPTKLLFLYSDREEEGEGEKIYFNTKKCFLFGDNVASNCQMHFHCDSTSI